MCFASWQTPRRNLLRMTLQLACPEWRTRSCKALNAAAQRLREAGVGRITPAVRLTHDLHLQAS